MFYANKKNNKFSKLKIDWYVILKKNAMYLNYAFKLILHIGLRRGQQWVKSHHWAKKRKQESSTDKESSVL